MREDFLHFVWEHRLFNVKELKTTAGNPVVIKNLGVHNFSSGPDFLNARIFLDDTEWAGSVEIHVRSSDWQHHGHQNDPGFDNVILHVVFEDDKEIANRFDESLPTIELKGRIPGYVLQNYDELKASKGDIPCASHIADIKPIEIQNWLDRVLVERIERKAKDVALVHEVSKGDWLQTFYVLIAGCLGQNTNKLPMIDLAQRIKFNTIVKHKEDALQLHAMMLGTAGFLHASSNHEDDYISQLEKEFAFQSKKYALRPVSQRWKTGRVRPDNSPSRRVAQLASMIPYLEEVYHSIIQGRAKAWNAVELFTPGFWIDHYSITAASSAPKSLQLSKSISDIISINAHIPFLFYYGSMTGDTGLKDSAIEMLSEISIENNKIVRDWKNRVPFLENAGHSQAVIELQSNYCNHKNCVLCNIGRSIIAKA